MLFIILQFGTHFLQLPTPLQQAVAAKTKKKYILRAFNKFSLQNVKVFAVAVSFCTLFN